MNRKVIIEFLLVPESVSKKSKLIESEILKEFNEGFLKVPWCHKIGQIRVVDA